VSSDLSNGCDKKKDYDTEDDYFGSDDATELKTTHTRTVHYMTKKL